MVMKYKNPFIHGTLFVDKNIFEEVGGYDENFYFAQDYKFYIKIVTILEKSFH